MRRMEQRVRAPKEFEIHILRRDRRAATVTIEWSDAQGRVRQAEVPEIAVVRHARQAGRRKHG
jgi:hypothetical protein